MDVEYSYSISCHSEKIIDVVDVTECPSKSAAAGTAAVCDGCPGRLLCQSQGGVDVDQPLINTRMRAIAHKVFVMSGKGGVGKSSVSSALAMVLATIGHKVGIVDVDLCGPSQPKLMAVEKQHVVNTDYGWKPMVSPHADGNIKVMSIGALLDVSDDPVMWRGPRKTHLIKCFLKDTFWGRLDYLIFDTPPGTSDEHLAVIQCLDSVSPDGAIIVVTPQSSALVTARKEFSFCRKMGLRVLGVVENMSGFVCPCCNEVTNVFSEGGGEALAEEFEVPFLGRVPLDARLGAACDRGEDLMTLDLQNTAGIKAMQRIAAAITSLN